MSDYKPSDINLLQTIIDEFPRRKPSHAHDMDQEEVMRILTLAEIASIPVVVAGGWAVDALLGWQTRSHGDLDIAINRAYLGRLLGILGRIGYGLVHEANVDDKNYLVDNGAGHQIEINVYSRDDKGRIMSGARYPSNYLTGQGKIGNIKVSCVSPEWLVDSYSEKEINQKTLQDLKYICNLYRLPLPIEFQEYDDSLYMQSSRAIRVLPADFQVIEPKTGSEYAELVFQLSDIESHIAEDIRQNESARFEKVFIEDKPNPYLAAQFDLRTGLLLKRDRETVGAIELGPVRSALIEEAEEGKIWQIKQIRMGSYSQYARIFRYLIQEAYKWAINCGATQLRVVPLDDVSTGRPALLSKYDEAYIGYATKYEQLGFEPLKGVSMQRLILVKQLTERDPLNT